MIPIEKVNSLRFESAFINDMPYVICFFNETMNAVVNFSTLSDKKVCKEDIGVWRLKELKKVDN